MTTTTTATTTAAAAAAAAAAEATTAAAAGAAAAGDPDAHLIAEVARAIIGEPSLDIALWRVVALLAGSLGADGCIAYLVEQSGDLVVVASFPGAIGATGGLRLLRGFGVTGRVAADAVAVTLVDDNPRNPQHRELLGLAAGQRVSRLCVPARLPSGDCAAVLAVHDRSHRVYSSGEVATAQRVADLVALRVGLAVLSGTMEQQQRERDQRAVVTVAVQEAERRRVAGDLHDGVSQAIAGLAFHLSAAELGLVGRDLGFVATQVAAAQGLADLAFGEARSAITGLHSPILDDLGLAAGLESMAHLVPDLHVQVEAQVLDLPDHVCVSLFRVAQEAIRNVAKHAAATTAVIRLAQMGEVIVLTIADDGRGFEVPDHLLELRRGSHYGLAGIAERAHLVGGRLRITSEPAVGTVVEVVVPLGR